MEELINLAYSAGIIDGEGTVTLVASTKSKFKAPCVSVSSTTYELLDFLKTNYGGYISTQKVYKEHHKQSWSWSLRNDKAIVFLDQVLLFLKEPEKRRRAELIVSRYKTVTLRNGRYNDEQLVNKLEFEQQFFHPSDTVA